METLRSHIISLFIILTCLLISCSENSPTQIEGSLTEQLQQALDDGVAFCDGKGVSAAVIILGHQIWLGTSGISHETTPLTSNMLLGIGSITKTFIAGLTLKLVEDAVFSLDDPISNWLPAYPNIDGAITIRQLLNHTSGVFNTSENATIYNRVFEDLTKIWTPEEMITEFVSAPYFEAGTDHHYANTNYILLGMIIEAATGTGISDVLRNRILEPLNLNHTFMFLEEELIGVTAHPWWDYDFNDTVDDLTSLSWNGDYSSTWTAGCMFSTAEDLAEWYNALLYEKTILNQSSLNQMLDYFPADEFEYGLGIRTFPSMISGVQIIGHTGTLWGYSGILIHLPEYGVSISVLLNKREGDCREAIAEALTQTVLDNL
ncbi:serine hydrolase domain-containing protein [Bacteroidota bacterium]